MKRTLVVFDFDGLLIDSYRIIRTTFADYDLDVGDERRFRNRRKFLKYFGGGRELLNNLARIMLPAKRHLRETLTAYYATRGRTYAEFVPLVNACIHSPAVHVGVISRNFALKPGITIRTVLRNSGIDEADLDFVVPLSVGSRKNDVLAAMQSSRYEVAVMAGDEIGDYRGAIATGYEPYIATYGFDDRERLLSRGEVPPGDLYDTPADTARALAGRLAPWLTDATAIVRALPESGRNEVVADRRRDFVGVAPRPVVVDLS